MTGIERLRELGGAVSHGVRLYDVTSRDYDEREGLSYKNCGGFLGEIVSDIADQIERDHNVSDREDREAVAWVRDHGGLDSVKEEWHSRVPYDRHEKTRQRLLDHIAECETALGRRRRRIKELGRTVEFFQLNNSNFRHLLADVAERLGFTRYGDDYEPEDLLDALDRRLLPEGMEWLVEAWPRFEDHAPLKLGDTALIDGEADMVEAVQLWIHGKPVIYGDGGSQQLDKGERVKRPAPKALDADGVEIRVGDRVWSTQLDEPHEWIVIDPHEDRDDSQTVLVSIGDRTGHARPENLTHQRPSKVLDADGVEIKQGDTVYRVGMSTFDPEYNTLTVTDIRTKPGLTPIETKNSHDGYLYGKPEDFTHRAPVLAADGRPLREGETVWDTNGDELVIGALEDGGHTVTCRYVDVGDAIPVHGMWSPSDLTHERPVADTWERLEEDAENLDEMPCDYSAKDIVRRAKKLAGVSE